MIGALVGLKNIPPYMVEKVYNCDPSKVQGTTRQPQKLGRERPKFLIPKKHLKYSIQLLIASRPTDNLKIIRNN